MTVKKQSRKSGFAKPEQEQKGMVIIMKVYSVRTYIELLTEAGLLKDSFIAEETAAVEQITYDSKEVCKNSLFACKGAAFKEKYLSDAVLRGACCYMSEIPYQAGENISRLIVTNVRKAMALVADFFYDKAYEKLKLIGITGTKGKSTTAYYIKYIIDEYMQSIGQKPCGILSSIDTFDGKVLEESHLTTPEAFMLHRHFDNAVQSGIKYFVMEVSSQALKYDRVLGVSFDSAVFLNISEDHISPVEHSDFEDYFSSKLKIFSQSSFAAVNLDADYSKRIVTEGAASEKLVTFGENSIADYKISHIRKESGGTHFHICGGGIDDDFVLTMPGLFNVENAAAAIAVCRRYEIPLDIIKAGLKKARSSGRMETYQSQDKGVVAIVDYAHNKLSFQKLYESTMEEYKGWHIITVFGCPGGKAYNRRIELGDLSGKYSDKVYLTAEDPGYEEVSAISADIKQHVTKHTCECHCIDDRGEAIITAIMDAMPNTVILITGKGNETRQKIGSEYLPCPTDVDYVKQGFERLAERAKLQQ